MISRLIERVPLGAAQAIRYKRHSANLSGQALALKAGFSPSYVGKVEREACLPSLRAFARLAVALGMNKEEVFLIVLLEAARDTDNPVTPPPYPHEAMTEGQQ